MRRLADSPKKLAGLEEGFRRWDADGWGHQPSSPVREEIYRS